MFSGQEERDPKARGAKHGIDADKGTRRRMDRGITMREKAREGALTKLRRQGGANENEPLDQVSSNDCMSFNKNTNPASIPVTMLNDFVGLAQSDDDGKRMYGTMMIRKLLSVEKNPPLNEVINTDICPLLVTFLTRSDFPELQFEAAWALTNVASGTQEHTSYIIDLNTIPHFITLLSSPSEDCREQAAWAIGNLAGDSAKFRDYVLQLGAMEPLLRVINTPCDKVSVLRNAVWALSNLCRSKPPPELEKVAVALPVLSGLMRHQDDEVVTDACWAISYISDGPNDRIQRVLEAGVLDVVVQMLSAPTSAMQTPAIRTIGNVVTGNDMQTQTVINAGALSAMHFLLAHPKRSIRKETCWTLSNIAAGTPDQIQAIINANLFPSIMKAMLAAEFEVKKEAVWTVANATSGGTKEQIRYLVEIGVLNPLVELLSLYDAKIVVVALEAITNVLQVGEDDKNENGLTSNRFAAMLNDNGGLDKIEGLQNHTNNEVYNNAMTIVETFFELEDVPVQNLAPQLTSQASGFAFGGQTGGNTNQYSF